MFPEAALICALTMNVRFTKEEKTLLLELLHPELSPKAVSSPHTPLDRQAGSATYGREYQAYQS